MAWYLTGGWEIQESGLRRECGIVPTRFGLQRGPNLERGRQGRLPRAPQAPNLL